MTSRWERIARTNMGDDYAHRYAEHFRELAASDQDVHGEATFAAALVPPPARVLDAGCGTGRAAVRLHELGYEVVGCDVDAAMVDVARAEAPHLDWRVADLGDPALDLGARFDLVLVAGNVVPLLEPGTLDDAVATLARHLADGGRLVWGFGLDAAHLPAGCPPTPLADVEAAVAAAGLVELERLAGWDGAPWAGPEGGYLVSVLATAREEPARSVRVEP